MLGWEKTNICEVTHRILHLSQSKGVRWPGESNMRGLSLLFAFVCFAKNGWVTCGCVCSKFPDFYQILGNFHVWSQTDQWSKSCWNGVRRPILDRIRQYNRHRTRYRQIIEDYVITRRNGCIWCDFGLKIVCERWVFSAPALHPPRKSFQSFNCRQAPPTRDTRSDVTPSGSTKETPIFFPFVVVFFCGRGGRCGCSTFVGAWRGEVCSPPQFVFKLARSHASGPPAWSGRPERPAGGVDGQRWTTGSILEWRPLFPGPAEAVDAELPELHVRPLRAHDLRRGRRLG